MAPSIIHEEAEGLRRIHPTKRGGDGSKDSSDEKFEKKFIADDDNVSMLEDLFNTKEKRLSLKSNQNDNKLKGIGSSIHYATPVPMLSYYKKKYNLNWFNI